MPISIRIESEAGMLIATASGQVGSGGSRHEPDLRSLSPGRTDRVQDLSRLREKIRVGLRAESGFPLAKPTVVDLEFRES